MSVADNPKSYDQAFKTLSDTDPRGLLEIFGVLPAHARAEVEPLPRDLSMRPLTIDSGYLVRRPGRKPYIVLFEAVTSWKAPITQRLAWYGAFLGHKYDLPVHVHVVPLTEDSCPRRVPSLGRAVRGGVTVTARLNWVKPWKIDGRVVLDLQSPELDPWAVLFQLSGAQLNEAMARLTDRGEPLFRILGGLRYRKRRVEWQALLEGMDKMLNRELFRESIVVQELLEEGRVKGHEEGLRDSLVLIFNARFPGIPAPQSIRSISDHEALNRLLTLAANSPDAASVVRAIERAAKSRTSRR